MLIGDVNLLIPDRNCTGQHRIGIECERQPRAVLQMNLTGAFGFEVTRQVQAYADIGGQQRRQLAVLLHLLQFQQAGVDFLGRAGRVTEPGEDIAQHRRGDFLLTAIGVDPVDGEAGSAGENFQLRIAHRRSPSRGGKGVAAVRLTSAQYGGSCPSSVRPAAGVRRTSMRAPLGQ